MLNSLPMKYHISKPSPWLSKFVKHYWSINNCIPAGQEHTQRIVPHGLLELTFYLGDKPVSKTPGKSFSESTLITGQLSEFYDIQIAGKLSLFSILFYPHGLSRFTDLPLSELSNQNVPLKFIFKEETVELESRLYEAVSFAERIAIAERHLLRILQKNKGNNYFNRIEESVQQINQSKGLASIDFLASEACYSRKQFERAFSHSIGTSPKQFLKIVRFQNALAEKAKNKAQNLTELTFKCGYYDQSHMTNDFQKLSGMSPKQYFNEGEAYSDYFQ